MSLFTVNHQVAEKLRELVKQAPAGGIFTQAENNGRISPVESHGLVNGPCFFYVEVEGRTIMVSTQDVTAPTS